MKIPFIHFNMRKNIKTATIHPKFWIKMLIEKVIYSIDIIVLKFKLKNKFPLKVYIFNMH